MNASHIFGDVGGLALWAALAWWQVRQARAVWRGQTLPWLPMTARGPEINRRNQPVFAASTVLFFAAAPLLLAYRDLGWTAARYVGAFSSLLGTVGLLILTPVITSFNRPTFLVPPDLRRAKGTWAARRAMHARQAVGLPDTEHVVELHDVRPSAGGPKPFTPYFVALCSDEDCDWMSEVVDQDAPRAEERVRHLAREHSSRLSGPIRSVLDQPTRG